MILLPYEKWATHFPNLWDLFWSTIVQKFSGMKISNQLGQHYFKFCCTIWMELKIFGNKKNVKKRRFFFLLGKNKLKTSHHIPISSSLISITTPLWLKKQQIKFNWAFLKYAILIQIFTKHIKLEISSCNPF